MPDTLTKADAKVLQAVEEALARLVQEAHWKDEIQQNASDLIYFMTRILTVNNSPILHIPQGLAMALRRWRISKRCCQVVKYLAKEPSIKVEVKSLPQPACLGWKVTVAEYEPAVMLTIGMHWSTCSQCF